MAARSLPPFIGIRIKPFTEELRARSFRTLDVFLTTLVEQTQGQAAAELRRDAAEGDDPRAGRPRWPICSTCSSPSSGSRTGALKFEIMIETTQSIFDPTGTATIPHLIDAARGRCVAAHFGTYDYTASCSITAAHQEMTHPACDFAKNVMQVALARHGDLALRRRDQHHAGARRTRARRSRRSRSLENRAAVHAAWRLHVDAHPPLARAGLLPGLGSPPGAAPDALRRGLRVLPRGARAGRRAPQELRRRRPRRRRWSATCSTTRRPGRGSSTSSSAASTAAPSRKRRRSPPGSRSTRSAASSFVKIMHNRRKA